MIWSRRGNGKPKAALVAVYSDVDLGDELMGLLYSRIWGFSDR